MSNKHNKPPVEVDPNQLPPELDSDGDPIEVDTDEEPEPVQPPPPIKVPPTPIEARMISLLEEILAHLQGTREVDRRYQQYVYGALRVYTPRINDFVHRLDSCAPQVVIPSYLTPDYGSWEKFVKFHFKPTYIQWSVNGFMSNQFILTIFPFSERMNHAHVNLNQEAVGRAVNREVAKLIGCPKLWITPGPKDAMIQVRKKLAEYNREHPKILYRTLRELLYSAFGDYKQYTLIR